MESKRKHLWITLALVLLAFGLRFYGLEHQSLWRDEVDSIRFASLPLGDLIRTYAGQGQNGPLYYLYLRLWLGLFGESEFALRSSSAVAGVLGVALCYRVGRRLFGGQAGPTLASALLCAMSPYLVWYAQEGKMYAHIVAITLLIIDLCLGALEHGGWQRWLALALLAGLAPYVHFALMLLVPVVAGIILVGRLSRGVVVRAWLVGALGLLVLLLCAPLLRWQIPLLLRPAETGFEFVPLAGMVASLIRSHSLGVAPGAPEWLLVPPVVALLAGLLLLGANRGTKPWPVLVQWAVIPTIGLYVVSLSRPLFTTRYLITVAPALILLEGAGFAAILRRSRLLAFFLMASILVVSGWALWIQAGTPLKTDYRSATRYLLDDFKAGDLVVFQIPHGRYSFEYYRRRLAQEARRASVARAQLLTSSAYVPLVFPDSRMGSWYYDGLYTNAGMYAVEVDRRLSEAVDGRRAVWLVATETELWDARRLVETWLGEHLHLTQQSGFRRVTVSRFEPPR